jgi:uroporphyrinogen decarboxylase
MRRALAGQAVDRLPTQITYTADAGERLAAHFNISVSALPDRLDNHILRLDLTYPRRTSPDGGIAYDWWGAGWSTREEGYFLLDAPLADVRRIDTFVWPDPSRPKLLDEATSALASDDEKHFVVPNLGFCLFERAWSLRGFDTFLMDLLLEPRLVEELLERITEIQVHLARRYVALGVDGAYFGDDYGAQNGLLFSPKIWRRSFKPRLARMFQVFCEAGLPVIMHSDGQITEILPDLIEIGLSVLNPVQPEVLEHGWLKRAFGDGLAFYGGISTQSVLPHGSPAQVREAVARCVHLLAADGTGLVLAPSHRLMADVPMENVDALLQAFDVGQGG